MMKKKTPSTVDAPDQPHHPDDSPVGVAAADASRTEPAKSTETGRLKTVRKLETIRWAIGLVVRPILLFVAGAGLLALLGVAQRAGWITSSDVPVAQSPAAADEHVDWICPMMCTPPLKEPGRCPVCGMELVPATKGGGGDDRSIVIDPATRRVANIQTVAARQISLHRTINAVGELQYDEGNLKTIAAYSGGRFDKLYVNYTGAVVNKGDPLASFYSPELYSAQVEFLQSRKAAFAQRNSKLQVITDSNSQLLKNARQRLVELGMSPQQISTLQESGVAESRIDILAPMSGTVIEKMAVEGEYVTAGRPVFRLAGLKTVWLMLELFPEDAAAVRNGQMVTATVQSLPGREFSGQIAFIDPEVNRKLRTVRVRVEMENPQGTLRVGDYAKARIEVPLLNTDLAAIGDIATGSTITVVSRSAVLMAAGESLVYVETETGRFEIRRVVVGPTVGQEIVILEGLASGEIVATSGNFLLDSQMQLAGNPSLIDPTRAAPPIDETPTLDDEMLAEIRKLPELDQALAIEQVICPVTEYKLGSMGVPPKVMVNGTLVFLCCDGCRDSLLEEPEKYLKILADFHDAPHVAGSDNNRSLLPPVGKIEAMQVDVDDKQVAMPKANNPGLPEIGSIEVLPTRERENVPPDTMAGRSDDLHPGERTPK